MRSVCKAVTFCVKVVIYAFASKETTETGRDKPTAEAAATLVELMQVDVASPYGATLELPTKKFTVGLAWTWWVCGKDGGPPLRQFSSKELKLTPDKIGFLFRRVMHQIEEFLVFAGVLQAENEGLPTTTAAALDLLQTDGLNASFSGGSVHTARNGLEEKSLWTVIKQIEQGHRLQRAKRAAAEEEDEPPRPASKQARTDCRAVVDAGTATDPVLCPNVVVATTSTDSPPSTSSASSATSSLSDKDDADSDAATSDAASAVSDDAAPASANGARCSLSHGFANNAVLTQTHLQQRHNRARPFQTTRLRRFLDAAIPCCGGRPTFLVSRTRARVEMELQSILQSLRQAWMSRFNRSCGPWDAFCSTYLQTGTARSAR